MRDSHKGVHDGHSVGQDDRWLRVLGGYAWRSRRAVLVALAATVVSAVASLTAPLIERHIIDDAVDGGRAPLAPWLLGLLALGVVGFAASRWRRLSSVTVGLDVQLRMRDDLHRSVLRSGLTGESGSMTVGQLVSRSNADLRLILRLVAMLPTMLSSLLLLLGTTVIMAGLSLPLAAVSLMLIPLIAVPAYVTQGRLLPSGWDAQQRTGQLTQIISQGIRGAWVVRAFGAEEREISRFAESARSVYAAQMRSIRMQARYEALLMIGPAAGQVAALGLGGWLAIRGDITIGTYLSYASYLVLVIGPARFLVSVVLVGQAARVGTGRILDLLHLPLPVAARPDSVPLDTGDGSVRLEGVRVLRPDGSAVLDGVDLEIPGGSSLALVGRSGSGKSVLARCVARLLDPDDGRVLVGGTDLRDTNPDSVPAAVSLSVAEPFLFSGTIAENIAFAQPDATPGQIAAAARVAAVDEFVESLPDGYDTEVTEAGASLSGGQRQRIALARTVLVGAPVLVLDDATSGVDGLTEQMITDRLAEQTAGVTRLVVAQRPAVLQAVDRVAVLEDGRIVEQGPHDELYARSPRYRALVDGADPDPSGPARYTKHVATPDRGPDRTEPVGPPRVDTLAQGRAGAELLAAVDALPADRDEPDVDDTEATSPAPFRLRDFLRPFRGSIALAAVLVGLDTAATVLGPYLSRQGLDFGVLEHSYSTLGAWTGVYALINALDLLVLAGVVLVTGRLAQRIIYALRLRLWAHLNRVPISYYDTARTGDVITRMTGDVNSFYTLLQDGVITAGLSVLTVVGVVAAMFLVNVELAALASVLFVPLVVATVMFRARVRQPYVDARDGVARVTSELNESLLGLRETTAFGQRERRQTEFSRIGGDYRGARLRVLRISSLYFPFIELLTDLAAVLVLWRGYVLVTEHALSAGQLIAFPLYLSLLLSAVQQLSTVVDDWMEARVSVGRLRELLVEHPAEPAEGVTAPDPAGRPLRLDKVGFGYETGDPILTRKRVLHDLDLDVEPGRTLALVGPSGSGKSTVIKLMVRLYEPEAGGVYLDEQDVGALEPRGYRARLGYVPQDTYLFTGTVAQNIAYGVPGATIEEVEAAAREVGIDEFVRSLPGGYDHVVGEGRRSLSAGQAQLVAIARATMRRPDVLLLDEATANLDPLTEARVSRAVTAAARGRTVVLVAHRLQTARRADRIAVVSAGRVVESGSHDELLAAGGRYAEMWEHHELSWRGQDA